MRDAAGAVIVIIIFIAISIAFGADQTPFKGAADLMRALSK